jgi:hypothetical protein
VLLPAGKDARVQKINPPNYPGLNSVARPTSLQRMANAISGRSVRSTASNSRSFLLWLAALLATPLLWFAWWILALPAHVFNGPRLILYDQGSMLFAVERVLQGESLYSQLAWQYGPCALMWYEAWAGLLGNTPMTLAVASGAATGLAWIGWVALAAKATGRWAAWLGGTLLFLPAMTPSCWLGINDGPHSAVVALVLSMVAWATYGACARNEKRWLLLLGASLGLMQLVKFGPHAVAGVAAALLVVVCRWRERGEKIFPATRRTLLWMLAGFALVEIPLVATLALQLPWPLAQEQLWPRHILAAYSAMFHERLPRFGSWREALGLPLLAIVALALTGWCLSRKRKATSETGSIATSYALAFSGLYFLLAFPILMRSDYAVLAGLWLPLPALALAGSGALWLRRTTGLLMLPAAFLNVTSLHMTWVHERDWKALPLALPNGQLLWFREKEAAQFGTLRTHIEKAFAAKPSGAARRMVVFGAGGGVRFFFNTSRIGRHWWYLAEFVRPWEQQKVLEDLQRHELLLAVVELPNASSAVVSIWTPLRPDLATVFLSRLRNARIIPGIGYLLDIDSPENATASPPQP